MARSAAGVILAAAAVCAVAGCSLLPGLSPATPIPDSDLPVGVQVVEPPAAMTLRVANGTDRALVLAVNGSVRPVEAGAGFQLDVGDIGQPPWHATLATVAGRELLAADVRPGDVWRRRGADGSIELHGAGAMADLSCGRIELWSGVPIGGPAPGPGEPGDCD